MSRVSKNKTGKWYHQPLFSLGAAAQRKPWKHLLRHMLVLDISVMETDIKLNRNVPAEVILEQTDTINIMKQSS